MLHFGIKCARADMQTAQLVSGPRLVRSADALAPQPLAVHSPELCHSNYDIFVDVAADLVATACLERVGANRIRFERVRARLSHLVREPVLDFEELARSERMSLRSLQRLFQLNGTTPGRVVLECRLEGAMRNLLSLPHARTIGETRGGPGPRGCASDNVGISCRLRRRC
jgi:AraC-like DNA-binding protein